MPVRSNIEEEIISIIRNVSGRQDIQHHQMIGRDIGIYGWDGIIVVEEIEKKFEIDLDQFIQAHTRFTKARWFDRLLGRKHGPPHADATVQELIDCVSDLVQSKEPSRH